jgi:hypothetical protein
MRAMSSPRNKDDHGEMNLTSVEQNIPRDDVTLREALGQLRQASIHDSTCGGNFLPAAIDPCGDLSRGRQLAAQQG